MFPTPSTPTLFPYTTLFRSNHSRGSNQLHLRRPVPACRGSAAKGLPLLLLLPLLDRKSTRLNSSHTVTSYAVFCLKKKTTAVCYGECKTTTISEKKRTKSWR